MSSGSSNTPSGRFFSKWFVLAMSVAFFVAMLIAWGTNLWKEVSQDTHSATSALYTDSVEIALIFVGCSFCPSANDEVLPETIETISSQVQAWALSNNTGYTTIGISNEKNVRKGVDYLTSIYAFDEIALGNAMRNTALQEYVWDRFDSPYTGSTPQVILSKRYYEGLGIQTLNEEDIFLDIKEEEILSRNIGLSEIMSLTDANYLERFLVDNNTYYEKSGLSDTSPEEGF